MYMHVHVHVNNVSVHSELSDHFKVVKKFVSGQQLWAF